MRDEAESSAQQRESENDPHILELEWPKLAEIECQELRERLGTGRQQFLSRSDKRSSIA